MKDWFLTLGGEPFTHFGISHIIMLMLYGACVILLYKFCSEISNHATIFQTIRWLLFSLLIGSEIIYQLWTATHGIWVKNLPLHLCGVASLIGAIALLTLHKKLMAISFFIGLIPAFLSLLTPDLPYDFPNFRYFKFFIHHIAISLTSIFFAITSDSDTISTKSMLETYGYLVVYALFVGFIINPALESNYLYLADTPTVSSPLDWFGDGILYRLNLGVVTFFVFYIQLQAFRFAKKKHQLKKRHW